MLVTSTQTLLAPLSGCLRCLIHAFTPSYTEADLSPASPSAHLFKPKKQGVQQHTHNKSPDHVHAVPYFLTEGMHCSIWVEPKQPQNKLNKYHASASNVTSPTGHSSSVDLHRPQKNSLDWFVLEHTAKPQRLHWRLFLPIAIYISQNKDRDPTFRRTSYTGCRAI